MEKYNLEKAQEEAAKLQQKVESGKAWGYADAEKQVEGEKPITPEMLKTKIIDLEAIQESRNTIVRYREQLAGLVERPLLSACQELYDKNIITLATSANKKDVEINDWEHPGQKLPGDGAYIIIDFDTLSAKNQEIGRSFLGKVYFADDGNKLKITIPLTRESTFEEVQTKAEEIAHKFVKQRYRVITYTIEEMRKVYGYEPNDESVRPEDFSGDYYWSPKHKEFFLSKEQYDKAMEQVDEEEKPE
jgi:hypothetical protein